jgi:hypothetical protein
MSDVKITISAEDKASGVFDKIGGKFADLDKKLIKTGQQMNALGNKLTLGLTLPLAAAGAAAFKYASDQGEALNAANVIFAEHMDVIEEFGKVAATQAGLSKTQFYQMGAEMGAILTGLGLDLESAADETVNLTKRAADMASIFNTDVDQAMAAIQSGLNGMPLPLRKFGVNLTEARIKAKALEMGLWDGTGAMDEQSAVLARLAVIYEQTDAIQGDFVRTSGEVANATRIATARFKDQTAELGTRLIPIGQKLIEMLSKLLDGYDKLSEGQKNTILVIGGLLAILGPLLKIFGYLFIAVGKLIPLFGLVVKGFGAIVIAVKAAGAVVSAAMMPVLAALAAAIGLVVWAADNVIFAFKQLGPVIKGEMTYLEAMQNGFNNLIKPIEWVTNKIKTFIDWVSKIKIPDVLLGKSPSPFEKSLRGITDAMDGLNKRTFSPAISGFGATASTASTTYNQTLVIHTSAPHEPIIDDFEMMKSWAGA